jgi:hypothetical protein
VIKFVKLVLKILIVKKTNKEIDTVPVMAALQVDYFNVLRMKNEGLLRSTVR